MPTPLRALILTDEPERVDLLTREFRQAGFTLESQPVNTAEGFAVALEPHRPAPDIILADCALERIDVMAALRLVQSRRTRIPFILFCDKASDETIAACIRLGAVDVVTPARLPHLAQTVAHALASPQQVVGDARAALAPESTPTRVHAPDAQTPLVFYNATVGFDSHVQYISPRVEQLLGYTQDEWLADPSLWVRSVHPYDFDRVVRAKVRSHSHGEPFHAEYRMRARDGRILWVHDESIPVRGESGESLWMRGILSDITERKQAETNPQYSGVYDALTGLYNHALFETELVRLAHGRRFPVSIIMTDVEHLQAINEQYDHAMGDEVLRRVAEVLRRSFRVADVVARIGEDEFAVLLCDTNVAAAAKAVVRSQSALSADNAAHPNLPLALSIGAVTAENGERLMRGLPEAKSLVLREQARKRPAQERDTLAESPASSLAPHGFPLQARGNESAANHHA